MTVYQQIGKNKRRSVILVALFFLLVMAIGYVSGVYYGSGYGGIFFAGIIATILTLISYFGGDSVSLAAAGAKQIEKSDAPELWNLVENLCITAGLPMPKVYIIEDSAMNAFATGRNPEKASIAFTSGLLANLTKVELEGVAAHELSHVRNYDTRLMMIVVVLVGVIALLADWMWRVRFIGGRDSGGRKSGNQIELVVMIIGIVLVMLSPLFAELIKLAISRKREFLADASAVLLTRYSDGLASALTKISQQNQPLARANHATAHLFIANPFRQKSVYSRLLSTHPPVEDRINALNAMGGDIPTDEN
ncbi:MAG: zinc metalloprotease HtpX [Candidatus Kerfeldbacteria bacterium CG15_BIG_FIL_POST_REV_8_21_14_020_45_12]|uniref:Protease HtpX homolog n=1 Tax=Candidatus Kerfeldbacteria bacterium CG15_BIG_FIL_POST_REV_8_21_14_020_45_12 TaxID=2014247 RepID=A0A2M7H2E1_9BACT|nr:MAG: zinc metalloprotease HtpX [Candidatus Kerfeldbacteria bacterium CG15_BIG_FIL_POST_REV_8_21_14_020_45_12]PJA93913.1 MAG: zinc metalloprotease HtpX [Candidatus Kerfeldbacteria bacterium CG_4_9_14_3_um_filter_45_8]